MKGYLLKNNTNKTLEIKDKKTIKIEPNSTYFYNGELLSGQIKLFERNNYISIEFIENLNTKLENFNKSIILEKEVIDTETVIKKQPRKRNTNK
jgi:hypothetical protein